MSDIKTKEGINFNNTSIKTSCHLKRQPKSEMTYSTAIAHDNIALRRTATQKIIQNYAVFICFRRQYSLNQAFVIRRRKLY